MYLVFKFSLFFILKIKYAAKELVLIIFHPSFELASANLQVFVLFEFIC